MRRTCTRASPVLALAVAVSLTLSMAGASVPPGSPKQVASLVAAAPSIEQLPADVTPPLASASSDNPLTEYPRLEPCVSDGIHEPACVFGDRHGARTMVLFGDSHALMWFPALERIALAAKWRLVALMALGCPVADVTVWNVVSGGPASGCPPFRRTMIARIDKLHPSLVVVSEGFYGLDASDQPITDADWTRALEASFTALHAKGMKKALIGQSYLIPDPIACLSAYPSSIQRCSRTEATPTFTAELAADRAAAKARGVAYVNEVPWTCSATCTVVIGNMIAYNSASHLSATYDAYLTTVLALALKPSMR